MKDYSFITNSHPAYIEGLYQDFVKDPEAVDPEFRKFFEGFDFAVTQGKAASTLPASSAGPAAPTGAAPATAASSNGAYTNGSPIKARAATGASVSTAEGALTDGTLTTAE